MMNYEFIKEINALIVRLEELKKSTIISMNYSHYLSSDIKELSSKVLYMLQEEQRKTKRIK